MKLDPNGPISVVVPLHDGARFIGRCLDSVAAQTVAPREVVVVDDGSGDDGADIAARRPGVTVLRQANAGAGPARNTGVAGTTAPWVAFLDADDVWFPTHLESLRRIVADVPDAGLVSTGHREVMDDRVADLVRATPPPRSRSGRRIDYFRRAGRRISVVWISAAAVRREAFDAVGGFADLSLPADTELWARLALRTPVAVSRSRTVLYVRGTGGLMERAAAVPRVDDGPWVELRRLTPSIRAVVAGGANRRPGIPGRSLQLYIDGRVTSRWRRVLIDADQARARRRWRELHHPWHWSAWAFNAAAWIPRGLGRRLARARRTMVLEGSLSSAVERRGNRQ